MGECAKPNIKQFKPIKVLLTSSGFNRVYMIDLIKLERMLTQLKMVGAPAPADNFFATCQFLNLIFFFLPSAV